MDKSHGSASYTFVVVEIDATKEPIGDPIAIVSGEDQNETAKFAFEIAHDAFHQYSGSAFGCFEVVDDRAGRLWMVAGYSRVSTGSRSAADMLSGFVSMAVA